jgi:iron-sulfur cluster repair protein YtfE (RIC family)
VNLLEKALMDLLQKRTTGYLDRTSDLQKDFLEAFKLGIILHFTVEEEALFPALKRRGKNTENLVDELLLQHQSIMEKHGKMVQTSYSDEEKREILLWLARELAEHGRREEMSVPPIVAQMSLEQLMEIDQAAKRLGYHV